MYDVDVTKIKELLAYSDQLLSDTKHLAEQIKDEHRQNVVQLLAAQRILQIHFEVFTDVANLLIDGFIMRDPGGYEDMVDIMDDEQVISGATSNTLRALIVFYRNTVKEYHTFSMDRVAPVFSSLYPYLGSFAQEVRAYIQTELPNQREL